MYNMEQIEPSVSVKFIGHLGLPEVNCEFDLVITVSQGRMHEHFVKLSMLKCRI